jgi:superfamily II DNA/RNA helicase
LSQDLSISEISPDDPVDVTFTDLGLHPKILRALGEIGYEKPTPIQAQAIPSALRQRDVLGIAQTGTGKTGAFTLPTMHKLATGRARARMPRCLIVCPTRELAAQVAQDVKAYGKYLKLEMALLIGGVSFAEQDKKLTRGVDILIATPGRLLDQFERGKILMTGVQTLVVDEADRMLDMGFIPDIERIFEITPFTRQVLFFSATMPPEIKRLVDQFLHQPKTVQIARRNSTAKTVRQRIARLPSSDAKLKRNALRWLIDQEEVDSGIIFSNRKRDVDIIAKSLNKYGYDAEPIHGDLPQSIRTKTLEKFKAGDVKFLIASDVAARGLDVSTITHVFNYDVPMHSEDYIHRIGRTGRAGRKGDAIMLVAPLDAKNYDAILDLTGKDAIEEIDIPGVDDFPREGRGGSRSRRGSRDDSKRRGKRRNGGSKDKSDCNAKSAKPAAKRQEPEDAAPRKPVSRRRAAPGRKQKDSSVESLQADENATSPEEKTKTSSRRSAPKKEDRQKDGKNNGKKDTKPSRKNAESSDRERKSKTDRQDRSRREDRRGRSGRPRRDHDKDDTPTPIGFGENVPSFFER